MSLPLDPLEILRSVAPFSSWTGAESALGDLAARAELWSFSEGDTVRFPDESGTDAIWVAEGCLVVIIGGQSSQFVGVRARLENTSGVTVKGQTSGHFVRVPQASWQAWLQKWPEEALKLGERVPAPLPRSVSKSPLVLETGEIPQESFRKSPFFLAQRAATPVFFLVLFLVFGLVLNQRFDGILPWWTLWFLPGLGITVTAALVVLVAWEWSASVLVVTDRSLIVRQIDLWSHRSDFEKISLERIREAVLSRRGWIDSLLGLVSIEIEGDSPQGRFTFRGLAQNTSFLVAMNKLKVQKEEQPLTRGTIRQALAARAGGARAPKLERAAEQGESPKAVIHRGWRTERNGGVWFRRHPWLVVRRTSSGVAWILLLIFLGIVASGFWPGGGWPISGAVLLVALFPLGKIAWEIADWANDRLSIQGDKIVMVHRRPLWQGEFRQEGDLSRVEQVGVRKGSLTALLFDFGTVTVSLGASEPLVFEHAHHPEWVQSEIFHRRTLLAKDRDLQESQVRLDEVSEILETWDQARQAGYFPEKPEPNKRKNNDSNQRS